MSETAVEKVKTITFDEPISFNGTSYTEVTLREPTSTEYDEASTKPGFGLVRHLMTVIGKLPPGVAAKVPLSKAREADEFVGRFLRPASPPTAPQPEPPQEGDAAIFDAMQLREPTLAELEAAGVGPIGCARLVHFTTGIPLEVALRMPMSLSKRCDAYFAGFAKPAQETGNS
ncbi:phage tail assembly protein [Roseomonas chloroacetimidivorans]|uniref:phage tail assembly protein n=1 Tax=Roseomonas chloroacetimidivorans TaxID=1766656 RepID=UPI003C76F173